MFHKFLQQLISNIENYLAYFCNLSESYSMFTTQKKGVR